MSTVCERKTREEEIGRWGKRRLVCARERPRSWKGGRGELSVFVYTCAGRSMSAFVYERQDGGLFVFVGRQGEWSEGFPMEGLTYILICSH